MWVCCWGWGGGKRLSGFDVVLKSVRQTEEQGRSRKTGKSNLSLKWAMFAREGARCGGAGPQGPTLWNVTAAWAEGSSSDLCSDRWSLPATVCGRRCLVERGSEHRARQPLAIQGQARPCAIRISVVDLGWGVGVCVVLGVRGGATTTKSRTVNTRSFRGLLVVGWVRSGRP